LNSITTGASAGVAARIVHGMVALPFATS
jgi:hypothetical protein